MSVLEKNSIDYIYVEDNHIIMGISDHLTWQEEAIVAHWQLLQDKLKNQDNCLNNILNLINSLVLKFSFPKNAQMLSINI